MSEATSKKEGTLPRAELEELRKVVHRYGERATCEKLRLAPATLARTLAGLPVRRGTLALVQGELAKRRAGVD